jgi:uncharacterized protein YbjT (DUF2867 family)
MAERTVLITGATGKQGGALLRNLVGKGLKLRAMSRKPEGDAGLALKKLGCEVVRGDLDDAASLKSALAGAWAVFAVQNTWEAGVEREEEQGKRIATLAREQGVQHFVYSSVGSAHKKTGIPHFDNKWRIEETVRSLRFPSHVILRPVFFMENLISPWFLQGDALATAMRPETVLQMIAVEDIGRIGAQAFLHAEELKGLEVDIAGDAHTIPQTAEILGRALGKRLKFQPVPIDVIRKNSEDTALMLEWFDKVGYSADIPAVEAKFGRMLKLDTWAKKQAK